MRCKLRWEAWNRVFSRALIERNGLRFEDNSKIFGEDLCFSLYYLPFVDRIRAIPDVLYDYRHRDESIMGENIGKVNLVRTARLAQFLEAFYRSKEAGRYLAEHYPPLFFMIVKGDLRRLDHSRIKKRQSCEAIREKLREELSDWAYFEENVRRILKDREAFHRYIGYMTRWNELAEYYFAYILCMPRSLKRTFVEAVYHIISVPVYMKYQLSERKKRRQ